MEFIESRVYTALNAGELSPGDKVFVADSLAELRRMVQDDREPVKLLAVEDDSYIYRFKVMTPLNGPVGCTLAYLVEGGLSWKDLRLGDCIRIPRVCGSTSAMVTAIDTEPGLEPGECSEDACHIYAAGTWLSDWELKSCKRIVKISREEE